MGGTNFVPTFRYEPRTRSPFRGGCLLFFTVNLAPNGGRKSRDLRGNGNHFNAHVSPVAQFPRALFSGLTCAAKFNSGNGCASSAAWLNASGGWPILSYHVFSPF